MMSSRAFLCLKCNAENAKKEKGPRKTQAERGKNKNDGVTSAADVRFCQLSARHAGKRRETSAADVSSRQPAPREAWETTAYVSR